MKKAFYIIVLLLLCCLTTKAQIIGSNLVNNPSFEEYYNCPAGIGDLYDAKYWWGISTDYFNACANAYDSVPLNWAGFQYAHMGVAYAGLTIYANSLPVYNNYRETIKTKLSDTLIANKRYCINFYISLAECTYTWIHNADVILDSIGMLFTNHQVQDNTSTQILDNGIIVQNSILNIDTINWFKISNSFIATGGEQYITIGNFDSIINWISSQVYVYIDDVSVCECSFKFSLGNDTTLCNGQTLQLKVSMPNATYTWQDGSTSSTYKVTQAGTYWVSAYFADYNITTTDTINVAYIDCDTTENIISIYPNPATDNLTIVTNSNEEYRLDIINLIGQTIYTSYINKKAVINTSAFAKGVYILKLSSDKETVVRKFVKE